MGILRNIQLKNNLNNKINSIADESIGILRQILINLESLGNRDKNGRLKVVVEDVLMNASTVQPVGSGTITSITKCTGVTVTAALLSTSSLSNIGNNSQDASFTVYDLMNYSYGSGVSKNLTRT